MDPLSIFLVGSAIFSTGTTIYGQITGAQAQEEAARKSAELKGTQADELLSRQAINEQIIRDKSEQAAHVYGAAAATKGTVGAGIGGILQIHKDTEENIRLSRRDAEFKAKMLRAGAEQDNKLASDTMTAGYLSGFGTLLTGASNAGLIYKKYGPSGTPQTLAGG